MLATVELLYEGRPILVQQEQVTLGRVKSCGVRVVHPLVSREHCRLHITMEGVLVEDLGSSNGTFINGVKVEGRQRAQGGDQITLGRDGASLILVRADCDGVEVTGDSEEDRATMLPGDPRAQAVIARISIASEVLPELGALEELPPESLYDEGYLDDDEGYENYDDLAVTEPQGRQRTYEIDESETRDPPTVPVGRPPAAATPVDPMDRTEPAPPATMPTRPVTPPARGVQPPDRTQPAGVPAAPRTEPVLFAPPPAAPPAAPPPSAPSTATGSSRLKPGLLIGFAVGLLLIIVIALVFGLLGGGDA